MRKARKICCRITPRRIMGAVVIAASIVNIFIVGAAYKASVPDATPTSSSKPTSSLALLRFSSATAEISRQVTLTPTIVPTQTFTATFTPTDTPTATFTDTPSPSPTLYVPQYSWPVYLVQRGDTLSSLASITASTVPELMLANCLPDTRIYAGQRLYVPRMPVIPTDTFTVVPNTLTDFGDASVCSNGSAINFSVTATDPEGIIVMTAFYRTDSGETGSNISLVADGDTYFGSQSRSTGGITINAIYYWFVATDTTGSITQSGEYGGGPLYSCGAG